MAPNCLHPTRRIVYSVSCSGNLRESFWGCLRLFRGVPGITLGVFGGHLGGKSGGRPKTKNQEKLFKIGLDSLFIEGGVRETRKLQLSMSEATTAVAEKPAVSSSNANQLSTIRLSWSCWANYYWAISGNNKRFWVL